MAIISLVPADDLRSIWPKIEGMLSKAVARAQGRTHISDVYADILTGKMSLWIAFTEPTDEKPVPDLYGCAVLTISGDPLMARLEYLGGHHLSDWLPDGFAKISDYVTKVFGVEKMDVECRPGMIEVLKHFGFVMVTACMQVNLKDTKDG